ncbi:MAG TPA: cytochrome P450 [Acidimicrobiales bacterium]|nr:cytochrome P450 [Acidimicrobiales bacterium]
MVASSDLTLDSIDIHSTDLLAQRGYPWREWDLLRRDAPVFWYERDDIEPFWAVTRYDDVHYIGANNDLFVNGGKHLRLTSTPDYEDQLRRRRYRLERLGWDLDEVPDLVYMDRPRHTAFRNLAARSFTPRAMRRLERHLDEYARRFIAEFEQQLETNGVADLVEDLAVKLPLATICDIMGVPVDDWARIHRWTGMFFSTPDEVMRQARDGESLDETRVRLSLEFYEYCAEVGACARDNHDGTLTARLVDGVVDEAPLTDQQLHGYLVLLIGAGNETTRNAIAGGVAALLQHPDQLELLCGNPDLVDSAVEEILRWVSPVIQFARTATADVELGGQTIRAGDTVGIFYPSANRDEAAFDEPYRFDITRNPNYHQAFGHGAHFCLGANLARWELRAQLRNMLSLLPRLRLAGDAERFGFLHLGIVSHQPIALR